MPGKFAPGPDSRRGKGGKREGAGRPTKDEQEEVLTLAQAIEREGQRRAVRLAQRYYEMAEEDPPTMRHVIDGTRQKYGDQQSIATTYQFIQFNNSLQSPTDAPIPVTLDEKPMIEVPVWAKKQD